MGPFHASVFGKRETSLFYSYSFTPLKESGRAHVEVLTFSHPKAVNNSKRGKVQMSGSRNKLA